jgi:hypothetical protein
MISQDRRSGGAQRYAVETAVVYTVFADRGREEMATGQGRTVNISSNGILFEASTEIPVGVNVQLFVRWPGHCANIRANIKVAELKTIPKDWTVS